MRINRLKTFDSIRLYKVGEIIPPVEVIVAWSTPAGELPDASTTSSYSTELVATTNDESAVSYTVTTGSLPTGLTLNASTGFITGTAEATGTSTFTVRASSGPFFALRTFSIEVFGEIEWVTPEGLLGTVAQDESFEYPLSAQ